MIGNDIVDLNLAKTQSNWQRKGFLEKQFTRQEQDEIWQSENPFLKVWLFWSMKEAAYKCHVQESQERFFAPKKISCKIVSNKNGFVKIKNKKYYLNYLLSKSYIYSVAAITNDFKMVSESFFITKNDCSTKIINKKLLSYFPLETQLKKNELGIPYLYQQNEKMPISISKSHHGNYGAFAFSI